MRDYTVPIAILVTLLLISGVAVGIMFSVAAGRPSWVLIGVFALDSIAIILIAVRQMFNAGHRSDGRPR